MLDTDAGEIDEMHIIHAARAGGHAGKAREAPVDVMSYRRGDGALLEHLLDQVDAAARGIALIAKQHIGRASGGAEAAMDAALEHGIGAGDGGILELLVEKFVCMAELKLPGYMRPALRMPARIEGRFQPRGEGGERRVERLEHVDARPGRALGADERRMTADSAVARRILHGAGVRGERRLKPDQAAGPVIRDLTDVEGARDDGDELRRAGRNGGDAP